MFKKLQRLDRKIIKLDYQLNRAGGQPYLFRIFYPNLNYDKVRQKRAELDQKRRDIRLQRKAHFDSTISQ